MLSSLPDNIFDCAITSPPYWKKREYAAGGIGLEKNPDEYIDNLVAICAEIYRTLKPSGSFWLNIGDSYKAKNLLNIPWRVALRLTDEVGFVQRNTVIWNKVKGGPDPSKDRLRNVYEPVFHFTKSAKGYYYDIDSVRHKPATAKVDHGAVVSATGVSGVRYKRKIELSTELTDSEKRNALAALNEILDQVKDGHVSDFRMIIRGSERATHSDSTRLSGRAKELRDKGFYFLKYNPNGAKPSDIWDIIPEDTQKRKSHFAPYPEDLCKTPILLTCPEDGIVLDPFVGTGTSALVATNLGRRCVGIDLSREYLDLAEERCGSCIV